MRVRIGIDVGGTFTHAVAIDNASLEVVAHAVTPTSHDSGSGVAAGVVAVFAKLRALLPAEHEVVFLAHSTTQATNALLEGDVEKVGIIGRAAKINLKGRLDMNVGKIELAPGKYLESQLELVPVAEPVAVGKALTRLRSQGCGVIVAAEPFSVDDATGEDFILERARAEKIPACTTHEMTGLYGLRVRTRTAVLNASILPKMIATAEMTERSLQESGVSSPLMVMRSDGGVMSLDDVRRRPVLTLLSGPAAGIAAALVYLRASDAFFLEVGGTSTDVCLIKNGRAAIRSAVLGGHPTYLKTLDSRTLGVAGGSMLRRHAGGAIEVGPRSAHLAGCKYASFLEPSFFDGARIEEVAPLPGDPKYLVILSKDGDKATLTTTDAANLLGYVPEGGYSTGRAESTRLAFELVARAWSMTPETLGRQMLESSASKIEPTLRDIIRDYQVKDRVIKLIGGGGGAAAIVPFLAERLKLPWEIAPRAEVISAIGAALAMVKETIERNVMNPTPSEVAALRQEAEQAVLRMGADPHTVTVTVDVDTQRNVVRAVATGSVELIAQDLLEQHLDEDERMAVLQGSAPRERAFRLEGKTGTFYVYSSHHSFKAWLGLIERRADSLWVTDGRGSIKLQVPNGKLHPSSCSTIAQDLEAIVAGDSTYGDGGASAPNLYLVAGHKILDYCGLSNAQQLLAAARSGLAGLENDAGVAFAITA